jgi:hypothetical protein
MHSQTKSGQDLFTANQHRDRHTGTTAEEVKGKGKDGGKDKLKDKDKEKAKTPDPRVRKTF